MPEEIGSHLLGRRPSPPDSRDFPLSAFLGTGDDPFMAAYAALLKSHAAVATKVMFTETFKKLGILEPPPPPPPGPPPSNAKSWENAEETLDQKKTSHCVGFSGAQWGNTLPVDDHFGNPDGDAIYYECKVLDGEPKAEDGSDMRSLAKALRNRGVIQTYAFAASVDEAAQWVLTNGPVLVGSVWTNDMFSPDSNNFVKPTGGVAGGHAYLLLGYDAEKAVLEFLNSWGSGWAQNGHFYMTKSDFETIYQQDGELLAAAEVAH